MVLAAALLVAGALVILAGFAAGRFFERTRFPDVPLLLGAGLLVGPVNRWAAAQGWGSAELAAILSIPNLQAVAPVAAGLALVVLLFDSSLDLDFRAFRRSLRPAVAHTLPILLCTTLLVAAVGLAFGMPPLVAAMLGVAVVNVDQAVSAGVLPRMRLSDGARATYLLEMALYDLLAIPLLVLLIAAAGGGAGGNVLVSFVELLSVSLALGGGAGVAWVFALRRLHRHPHSYMLTFAALLATYGLAELLGGSGALATLAFGLLLGNRSWVLRRLGRRLADDEHHKVDEFHDEVTFLVRTLYFLFLGALVAPPGEAPWPVEVPLLGSGTVVLAAASLLALAAIVASRYVPIRLAAGGDRGRLALFPVFGRGLDTAVLCTLPFIAPGFVAGTPTTRRWRRGSRPSSTSPSPSSCSPWRRPRWRSGCGSGRLRLRPLPQDPQARGEGEDGAGGAERPHRRGAGADGQQGEGLPEGGLLRMLAAGEAVRPGEARQLRLDAGLAGGVAQRLLDGAAGLLRAGDLEDDVARAGHGDGAHAASGRNGDFEDCGDAFHLSFKVGSRHLKAPWKLPTGTS